jgi:hypothetical protein
VKLGVGGLVAGGLANQFIADRLPVAPRTAEAHGENIRRKPGVHSRAQTAARVTEHPAQPWSASVVRPTYPPGTSAAAGGKHRDCR